MSIPFRVMNYDANDNYPACSPGCLTGGDMTVGKVYRKADGSCYTTSTAGVSSALFDANDDAVYKFSSCPKFCDTGMGFAAAGSEIVTRQEIDDISDASPLEISLEGEYGVTGSMEISGL